MYYPIRFIVTSSHIEIVWKSKIVSLVNPGKTVLVLILSQKVLFMFSIFMNLFCWREKHCRVFCDTERHLAIHSTRKRERAVFEIFDYHSGTKVVEK